MWQLSQIKRNVWTERSTPGLLCHGFATALKPTPPTTGAGVEPSETRLTLWAKIARSLREDVGGTEEESV